MKFIPPSWQRFLQRVLLYPQRSGYLLSTPTLSTSCSSSWLDSMVLGDSRYTTCRALESSDPTTRLDGNLAFRRFRCSCRMPVTRRSTVLRVQARHACNSQASLYHRREALHTPLRCRRRLCNQRSKADFSAVCLGPAPNESYRDVT